MTTPSSSPATPAPSSPPKPAGMPSPTPAASPPPPGTPRGTHVAAAPKGENAAARKARGEALLERLRSSFPADVPEVERRDGVLARVHFPREAVLRIGTWLRDEGTFTHCAMVGAIDWRESREVLYTLWSDELRTYLELTTSVPADDAHLESVAGIWQGANWHEREAWDLLGIRFDHHPDLRRLFLHEGYKFHPLLKTFELHEPEELEVKARIGR